MSSFLVSLLKSPSQRRFSKAILFTSSLLCATAPAFASKALYPCTDADLVNQGRDGAFNNVIRISMENPEGGLSFCSAAKVRILGVGRPLYLTAAHCLEGFSAVYDHKEREMIAYEIHPFYGLNPLADMALIEFDGETPNDGYLLYQGDVESVSPQSLVSVGYGGKGAENGTSSRRAFYAGKIAFDAFSINQQRDGVYPEEKRMCRGVTEGGDSGGPLFVKREDGTYEIVGIASQGSISTDAVVHTKWALVDSHFVEAIVQSPESVSEYMLRRAGKTWEEMATLLQNDPLAQYEWGWRDSDKGRDTRAFGWYMKAADQGYSAAQLKLGVAYMTGKGVTQNDKEAIKWFTLAADQGHELAQYNLGVMYGNGQGVTQNDKEAIKWYTLAADQGYAKAQYNLGVMYANGQDVVQNDKKAAHWYTLAAHQGHAGAQYNLGAMYANGQGVAQSDEKAFQWFMRAAHQGHAGSQYNLGVMYADGRGVTQSDKEALKWYKQAADQGYANAQYNLGVMYGNGRGVTRDDKEALKWFTLAANQGYANAQYNIGLMYFFGRGITQDNEEAIKWMKLSADQGYEGAKKALEIIKAEMMRKKDL